MRKGDTLVSIGAKFGVPWQEILKDNPCSPEDLEVGRVLLIPVHLASGSVPRRPRPEQERPGTSSGHEVLGVSRESLHRGRPAHPFWWPTGGTLTRRYSEPVRGLEEPGIGIAAPPATEVCSVAAGTVICCVRARPGRRTGWGNVVAVRHGGKVVSWYAQLARIEVKEGQKVRKGQRIGTVGSSGAAARPELALRFFKDERPVDPLKYLP